MFFCGCGGILCCDFVFFFKQKTAYEMRISDWSSDVCSSDLGRGEGLGSEGQCQGQSRLGPAGAAERDDNLLARGLRNGARAARALLCLGAAGRAEQTLEIGRASCRERVCQYV